MAEVSGWVYAMKRVCIICEGETEVEFVRTCLAPHFLAHNLLVRPSLIQSRHGNHRGGRVTVDRVASHISHEYHASDRVTTLVDFYGFQGADGRNRAQLESDILQCLESKIDRFDARFVLPYVQMYEFEGLLFTDVEQFQYVLDGWGADARSALLEVRNSFLTPEDINNSRETAPSKRIKEVFSGGEYGKTEHGPLIAEAIGVQAIRQACPQFNEWLSKVETWGALDE